MTKKKGKKQPPESRKKPSAPDNKSPKTGKKAKNVKPVKTLEKYLGWWTWILLAILVTAIGMIWLPDFFFSKYVYFFTDIGSDTINANIGVVADTIRLHPDSLFKRWSFYIGLGENAFKNVTNPMDITRLLNIIIHRFIDSSKLFRFHLAFFKHFVPSAILFYLYLRTLKMQRYTSLLGGLLVAFMGYMTLGSTWMHGYFILNGTALLFAMEQLLQKNRWYFFPLAMTTIKTPFDIWLFGIFIFIYGVFRYIDIHGFQIKSLVRFSFFILGLGIMGTGLRLVYHTSMFMDMFESPRVSGNASYMDDLSKGGSSGLGGPSYYYATMIMRTFNNDILGNGSNYIGWYNYLEAPVFYSGILTLLLIPQAFVFANRRRKVIFGAFLGFWMLIILFPYLRYAFYAFTGNYFKRGLDVMIPLIFMFYALFALYHILKGYKVHKRTLYITFIVLIVLLFIPYFPERVDVIDKGIRNKVALLLIIYTGIILMLSGQRNKIPVQVLLLAVVIIELGGFASITINNREAVSFESFKQSGAGYKDRTVDALNWIKSRDKGFYRIEKNYSSGEAKHNSLNDPQTQHYYGTTSYSSFNNLNYISFLETVGTIEAGNETQTRWARGVRARPLLQIVTNVKYNLIKGNTQQFKRFGYDSIAQFGDVTVMKNNFFVPFGFCYDTYIRKSDYEKLAQLNKDVTLFDAFIINEEQEEYMSQYFSEFNLKDTVQQYTIRDLRNDVNQMREDTLNLTHFEASRWEGTIKVDTAQMMFFSTPYHEGWSAQIDGESAKVHRINAGLMGIIVPEGQHEIKMEFWPPYLKPTLILTGFFILLYFTLLWITTNAPLRRKFIVAGAIVVVFIYQIKHYLPYFTDIFQG